MSAFTIRRRLRRLRKNHSLRDIVAETHLAINDLVQPIFIIDGNSPPEEIESMPGQFRRNITDSINYCLELYSYGVKAFAVFPTLNAEIRDEKASEALNENTLILRAITKIKNALPEAIFFSDIALDPYTSHGHDGVLNKNQSDVDNDLTVEILARMSVLHANAGADFVAPSDMMDGRIKYIRESLDASGFADTGIMSYAAKFNSSFYGPFRDAIGTTGSAGTKFLSKQTYQLDFRNRKQALLDAMLDEEENADMLMVKPAGHYLDIISDLSEASLLPILAYQISGEYSQIHAASRCGWLDYRKARNESLYAIKRAGAGLIFSYFCGEIAKELFQKSESAYDLQDYSHQSGI